MQKLLIVCLIMLTNTLCACNPPRTDNYFFTKIFDYETNQIDRSISRIYLINKDTGILLGDDSELVRRLGKEEKEQNAFLFRSTDGGHSLARQDFGKGVLTSIDIPPLGNSIYLTKEGYSTDKLDITTIYRSDDMGASWTEVSRFENKMMGDIYFFNDSIGFIQQLQSPFGTDNDYLFQTLDRGKTWKETCLENNRRSTTLITAEGYIYGDYLDDDKSHLIWKSHINDLKNIETIELKIPQNLQLFGGMIWDKKNYAVYFRLKEKEKENKYHLYNVSTNKIISLPDGGFQVHIYGDYIGVFAAPILFYSNYHYSLDGGNTWKVETPPETWAYTAEMYGRGYLWTIVFGHNGVTEPLMVRIPTEDEK